MIWRSFLNIMLKKKLFFFLFLILCSYSLNLSALKKEFDFMGLKLGMTEEEVKNILSENPNLKIDESRYLGKINEATPFILKAVYPPFIPNIYVQFYSNISYGITIQLNSGYFDFFSLSEKLEDKYGTPFLRSSRLVLWQDVTGDSVSNTSRFVKLRLEYPTTVKVFDEILMKQVNSEVSQNIVKMTNQSLIASNRRAILEEL